MNPNKLLEFLFQNPKRFFIFVGGLFFLFVVAILLIPKQLIEPRTPPPVQNPPTNNGTSQNEPPKEPPQIAYGNLTYPYFSDQLQPTQKISFRFEMSTFTPPKEIAVYPIKQEILPPKRTVSKQNKANLSTKSEFIQKAKSVLQSLNTWNDMLEKGR